MLARFGPDGARAHRLARGLDDRPLAARPAAPELAVQTELDPPVERVDTAAFAAKALAEQLHAGLARRGLACTRVAIEAQTEHGEQLTRLWRHEGVLTPAAIADRVRWQLDGWLSGSARAAAPGGSSRVERPTAGIVLLRLVPDEVMPYGGMQLGLWGGMGEADERAGRVLARVQGMLGPDRVLTAVLGGGRDPSDQVRLVPWGDERVPDRPAEPPWPGRLPAPSPATVLPAPVPAEVTDEAGVPVGMTERFAITGRPARLALAGRPPVEIAAWAGPWPADERWWTRRPRAAGSASSWSAPTAPPGWSPATAPAGTSRPRTTSYDTVSAASSTTKDVCSLLPSTPVNVTVTEPPAGTLTGERPLRVAGAVVEVGERGRACCRWPRP